MAPKILVRSKSLCFKLIEKGKTVYICITYFSLDLASFMRCGCCVKEKKIAKMKLTWHMTRQVGMIFFGLLIQSLSVGASVVQTLRTVLFSARFFNLTAVCTSA